MAAKERNGYYTHRSIQLCLERERLGREIVFCLHFSHSGKRHGEHLISIYFSYYRYLPTCHAGNWEYVLLTLDGTKACYKSQINQSMHRNHDTYLFCVVYHFVYSYPRKESTVSLPFSVAQPLSICLYCESQARESPSVPLHIEGLAPKAQV